VRKNDYISRQNQKNDYFRRVSVVLAACRELSRFFRMRNLPSRELPRFRKKWKRAWSKRGPLRASLNHCLHLKWSKAMWNRRWLLLETKPQAWSSQFPHCFWMMAAHWHSGPRPGLKENPAGGLVQGVLAMC